MSPSDYWDGPCEWAVSYRQAFEDERRRNDERAWLQGLYVYNAIAAIAPVLSFGGGKAEPYVKEPFLASDERIKREEAHLSEQEKATAAARQYMEVFMTHHNKTIKNKGGEPG